VRRIAVLSAVVISGFLASSTASARPPVPPLPCDYWIHGCNVAAYLCDAGICLNEATAVSIPVAKL
jgi:hypothetical protein